MGRQKLIRFETNSQRENVVEPGKPLFTSIKGKWREYFKNENPLVLEVGCGRGEYTTGLAGWGFVKQPAVNDRSQEKGTVIFKIFVNEEGVIENATVFKNQGGIKISVLQLYINALIGSELQNTNGATLNSMTEGSVTWVIVP